MTGYIKTPGWICGEAQTVRHVLKECNQTERSLVQAELSGTVVSVIKVFFFIYNLLQNHKLLEESNLFCLSFTSGTYSM